MPECDQNIILSPRVEFWLDFRRSHGGMLGALVLVFLGIVALFAPWIAPYDPSYQFGGALLVPPVWDMEGGSRFLLGTDDLGRDLLSRLIHGARYSLALALGVVVLSTFIGFMVGAIAALAKGSIETLILRLMDIILALPSLLLAIVVVAVLGPKLTNAVIAVAITCIPHFVRITRSSILTEMGEEYVKAAELEGASQMRILFKTLLPNMVAPLTVQATLLFSNAILDIAALGFLGLGAQPPIPEWGTILSASREYIESAPWTVTLPGVAILITVLATNLVGDALRDALDPRLKR
ncbi:MAG: ABC transporter permease subunit [Gammaproteobacteria bacterium]|nr:ABC transporter permease subunit [Gammaproteobacteria bacterium]